MSQPNKTHGFAVLINSFVDCVSRVRNKGLATRRRYKVNVLAAVFLAAAVPLAIAAASGQQIPFVTFIPNGVFFPNPHGASQTYSTNGGRIDLTGPFFQSLGTNGRTCGTCHQPSDGMSVSAANVQLRFLLTQGQDPIFRPVDGSNCNHNIDVSTLAGRAAAYSLLRTRGLIRIAVGVPANANYQVVSVNNPYGCNESDVISMYRRPLPATNLRFLSAVMFDGRESSQLQRPSFGAGTRTAGRAGDTG
jgi:cytochrome c peroxidase